MYERSAKGVRLQLIGLNLWVVALVFTFALTVTPPSIIQFLVAFIIFGLVSVGLIMFIIGLVYLLSGGKELENTNMVVTSLILLVLSPFVIAGGVFNIPPMNYIIIHIGLWMLLSSFVFPYFKIGGFITGLVALVVETAMLIYTLMVIMYSQLGITMPVVMALLGGYFLFLEFSLILSFLRIKRLQDEVQVVEGEGAPGGGDVEVVPAARPRPAPEVKRTGRMTFESTAAASKPNTSGFRVLEYEFSSTTSSPQKMEAANTKPPERPSPPHGTEPARRGPVVGRAINFEEAMKRARAKEKTREEPVKPPPEKEIPGGERYTIEDEEEIEISFEELYIDGQNLYEILRVQRDASSIDIRKAYRRRALLFHPDKNRDMGPLYAETIGREMRKINTAKDILLDTAKRSIYDRMLDSVS
ncbi:MAG: DnaJ domain-containing protein [Thermoplasmatota archaeon]